MATKDAQSVMLLLLLSSISVLSYLQFVVPGVTKADSSEFHISQLNPGTYPYWPNRTVDGNFSQTIKACLHTADKKGIREAWLRIDLETVKSVKSIKFWYRADRSSVWKSTERLKGYSIRVSNSSDVPAGSTAPCFTDDRSSTLPTTIDQVCKVSARYVWFYQTHAYESAHGVPILEICEVQVFGCETGTYGINCSRTCGHCENSETCDIDDGKCDMDGCAKRGYEPPSCNKCKQEFYGPDCSLSCSMYCQGLSCNSSSGECLNGCKPGYQTPNCNMPCPHGYYGERCAKKCGNCLNNQTCNNVNGTCTYGCDEGFKEDLCKTICGPYEYGRNCAEKCSDHCYNNEICDPFFGNCSKCADGYQNAKCDEKCSDGSYGEQCKYQCGECLKVLTCNHVDGKCSEGCKPGWQRTDKCDKPCRNGTFGINCIYNCSGNCENNDTCDKTYGTCVNCAPGWKNHYCNKTCDVGMYGSNCEETCGRCLKADNCSFTDGTCFGGCIEGYTGDTCHERIQSIHNTPESPDAAVIAAPVLVIVVLITVIAVVVILRKRQPSKQNKKKENSVQLQAIPEQGLKAKLSN